MRFLVTFLALVAAVGTIAQAQSVMKMPVNITTFEQFKLFYGKTYSSPEEESQREANFYKTARYVWANDGKLHGGVQLRINPLADLSDEEFQSMNQAAPPTHSEVTEVEIDEYQSLPTAFDWRSHAQLNAVENQGSCGSCWAFATSFTVEAQYAARKKQQLHLSKQELVDCASQDYDNHYRNQRCTIGYPPDAYAYIQTHGLTEESHYPYNGNAHEQCYSKRITSGHYFIQEHYLLQKGVNDQVIMQQIYNHGPVVVVIHGTSDVFRNYHHGIVRNLMQNSASVNHVVAVVGWGTEGGIDYWIIRNSWGAHWGENGYMRLERHHNNIAFNNWCSYPVLH